MIAVPAHTHLHRRGAVYHYRRRVPPDLLAEFGFADWRVSLKTKDLQEAKQRLHLKNVEVDREIATARARLGAKASPSLPPEEVRRIAHSVLADWLADDEERRLSKGSEAFENVEVVLEAFDSEWRQALAEGDWRPLIPTAQFALEQEGLWYPPGDASLTALAQELLKTRVRCADMLHDRQRGRVVETPVAPSQSARSTATSASAEPSVTVGQLIERYRSNRCAEHGEHSTERKYRHVFRALEEALGTERPVASITRMDCEAVRNLLRRVPRHAAKRYPGLTLQQAAEAGERDGRETMAANTVATYMQNLAAVLNHAVEHGWLAKNPARGMGRKARLSVRRRGFEPAELQTLFATLVTYAASTPSRYWVPALGVFTGARLNELCQLRPEDVRTEHGVTYVAISVFGADDVRDAGKRLKTAASERNVPVSPALIAAGFLDFVQEAQRQGRDRLFPDLKPGPDGTLSHGFSKWFARTMDAVGLTSRGLVFHSFRHGFRDACRRAEIDEETAKVLGGWTHVGDARDYGNAEALRILNRAILRIAYEDFTLPQPGSSRA
jgi:integrase